jgi:hypothetical protein
MAFLNRKAAAPWILFVIALAVLAATSILENSPSIPFIGRVLIYIAGTVVVATLVAWCFGAAWKNTNRPNDQP